ncbi:uncharacterized protein LOC133203193 [Saccostrea echinata]|uniref:uncharacterized protein LOC133203193 n=1 Tax=Saccostrea echinata TaxID=191078 RepID=UPI002A7F6359|nr:uncharacterized protein LOC133203193 [Saccostrea echinata]
MSFGADLRRLGAFTLSIRLSTPWLAGAWEKFVCSSVLMEFTTKLLPGLMADAENLLDRVLLILRYFKNSLKVGSSHGRSAVTMETVDSVSNRNIVYSSCCPYLTCCGIFDFFQTTCVSYSEKSSLMTLYKKLELIPVFLIHTP